MNIVGVRRLTQGFFLLLFLWLCWVTTLGVRWDRLRGWPVNWFLELDPLVAVGTVLSTGRLYAGLWWAVVTICLTVFVGRFFCGWVCPFGTMHQLTGWLAHRRKAGAERVRLNRYRPAQAIKYYLLAALLGAAAGGLAFRFVAPARRSLWIWLTLVLIGVVGALVVIARGARAVPPSRLRSGVALAAAFAGLAGMLAAAAAPRLWQDGTLQTGLLDPLPLAYRSVNLVWLAIGEGLTGTSRSYTGAWLIGAVFVAALALNALIPRFYCRFVCPLGALLGLIARWTPWRIVKSRMECPQCGLCEQYCEGACKPARRLRRSECVLCLNCLHACPEDLISYGSGRAADGEFLTPPINRRGFIAAAATGLVSVPVLRLSGWLGANWSARVIRPPGALAEAEFLARCLKCGQCMRLCPSNIIQPALTEAGPEGIWTPVLNYRIGTSGCQLACVACSQICPTGALRPLSVEEKLGLGPYAAAGPIRLGTASVDHGRCLPWAKDIPCIVCQEVCPVTPKAVYVREVYRTIRDGMRRVQSSSETEVVVDGPPLPAGALASGDYYIRPAGGSEGDRRLIAENTERAVRVAAQEGWPAARMPETHVVIELRLQLPYVDPRLCIGCGMCEHECPVSGWRAIRVTAENESRERRHALTTGG